MKGLEVTGPLLPSEEKVEEKPPICGEVPNAAQDGEADDEPSK